MEVVVIDNGDCFIVFDEFVNVFVLWNVKGEGILELKLVIDVFKGSVVVLFKVVFEECKGLGLFVGIVVFWLVIVCICWGVCVIFLLIFLFFFFCFVIKVFRFGIDWFFWRFWFFWIFIVICFFFLKLVIVEMFFFVDDWCKFSELFGWFLIWICFDICVFLLLLEIWFIFNDDKLLDFEFFLFLVDICCLFNLKILILFLFLMNNFLFLFMDKVIGWYKFEDLLSNMYRNLLFIDIRCR